MRVTLVETAVQKMVGSTPATVWAGRTAGGIAVQALVLLVAPVSDADLNAFEQEFQADQPPGLAPDAADPAGPACEAPYDRDQT